MALIKIQASLDALRASSHSPPGNPVELCPSGLLEARHKKKKTQWDITKEVKISQTKVSLIERGYIIPNDQEKEAIAKALGLSEGEIQWPV